MLPVLISVIHWLSSTPIYWSRSTSTSMTLGELLDSCGLCCIENERNMNWEHATTYASSHSCHSPTWEQPTSKAHNILPNVVSALLQHAQVHVQRITKKQEKLLLNLLLHKKSEIKFNSENNLQDSKHCFSQHYLLDLLESCVSKVWCGSHMQS